LHRISNFNRLDRPQLHSRSLFAASFVAAFVAVEDYPMIFRGFRTGSAAHWANQP
jgi:hypothetical protein